MCILRAALTGALLLWTIGVYGGATASQDVAGAGGTETIEASDRELPLVISVGGLSGEILATDLADVHTEGGSAFVQLTLRSNGDPEARQSAAIALETDDLEISSVSGSGVSSRTEGDRHIVEIQGIGAENPAKVLIELKLRQDADFEVNELRFSIRSPARFVPLPPRKDGSDYFIASGNFSQKTVALSWPSSSCSRNFHSALLRIGDSGGNELREAWRAAQSPAASMSRRWHFRPSVPPRSRRNSRDDSSAGPISSSRERTIMTETASLMSSGFGRDLSSRGRYGWTISKTADDLKKYFTQQHIPSICTGALGFAAYYEEQLAPLGRRSDTLASLARDAVTLARTRAVAFVESARNLPGGHPAWGGAGLDTLKPSAAPGGDLKSLIVRMLRAVNADGETITEAGAAPNAYDAIRLLDETGLSDAGVPSRNRRAELGQALAAVEAAARIEAYRDQYDRFWKGFSGSLQAIRAAHAEHCACGS